MASIIGVGFGTACDHLVRRSVELFLDTAHLFPFDTNLDEFWCRVDADLDLLDPQISLYVNQEPFTSTTRIGLPDEHLVIFTSITGDGFGLGGFGSGGFGMGGFNIGINIESLGNYPPDEVELEYRTTPRHCSKCVLREGDGSVSSSFSGVA